MANYTEHYQLHQWEPEDNFLRTDFNEDFKKIDTALGEKSTVIAGSYMGNGEEYRTIELGHAPKAIYLCNHLGVTYESWSLTTYHYGGICLMGEPLKKDGEIYLSTTQSGFQVRYLDIYNDHYNSHVFLASNLNNTVYYYIAFL